jgi:salicylate hydroxylase
VTVGIERAAVERVVIAGGGFAGLAAGIALAAKGCQVEVYERADESRELFAGVVLSPNGIVAADLLSPELGRRLRELGEANPADVAYPMVDHRGRVLSAQPPGDLVAQWGAPLQTIFRDEAHGAVLRAASDCGVKVFTGRTVTGFSQDPGGVVVLLSDGGVTDADLLVGADGAYSTVRAQLLGDGPPRYCGYSSVRGVLTDPRVLAEYRRTFPIGSMCGGRGVHICMAVLPGNRLYWSAVIKAAAGEWPAKDGATAKADLLARLSGWVAPVREMITATDPDVLVALDIVDRDPRPPWSRGRVVLVGDAAHPMTPALGQGINTSFEDAVVLAGALAAARTVDEALAAYEAERLPRCTKVVKQSRMIANMATVRNPVGAWLRDRSMTMVSKMFDPDAANRMLYAYRPSTR